MPSSTCGSFSMQSTMVVSSGAAGMAAVFGATFVRAAALAVAISTENVEPFPLAERSLILWSRTRAMRSTMESPSPRPRAARAP